MLVGAFFGFLVSWQTGSPWLGVATGLVAGAGLAALMAALSIEARADQIVTGIDLNILAFGVTSFAFDQIFAHRGQVVIDAMAPVGIPGLQDLGGIGRAPLLSATADVRGLPAGAGALVRSQSDERRARAPCGRRVARGRRDCGNQHPRCSLVGSPDCWRAGRSRRRLPFRRLARTLRPGDERRPGLHRTGRRHLRPLAPVQRPCSMPRLRRRRRAAAPAPGTGVDPSRGLDRSGGAPSACARLHARSQASLEDRADERCGRRNHHPRRHRPRRHPTPMVDPLSALADDALRCRDRRPRGFVGRTRLPARLGLPYRRAP